MVRGFLYLVLVLLGIGAITAALRDNDIAEFEWAGPEDPGADPEAAVVPSLEPSRSGRSPAGGAALSGRALVPAAIYEEALGLRKPGQPARLRPWLEEDGAHLLDLIAEHARRVRAKQDRNPADGQKTQNRIVAEVARWIRERMNLRPDLWPDLRSTVAHGLTQKGHPPSLMAGLLGAFLARPDEGKGTNTLRTLRSDTSQYDGVRLLAGEGMLHLPGATVEDEIALVSLIEAGWPLGRRLLYGLLGRLKERGRDAWAAVPALVRLLQKGISDYALRGHLFKTLQAIGSSHPDFQAALPALVMADHRLLSGRARSMLFGGDVATVLASMETMPPSARIEGVAKLLQRGVAPESLRSHVLAVLAAKGHAVRSRALSMLGKVGPDVADVMPILERHLDSKDHARWMTAVKALGLVATLPGNQDPAIQRLFGVTRSVDPRVRRIAVQSILMHAAKPRQVIEILSGLVRDSETAVRREAADGLGELVAEHPAARRALEAARNDTDADVRELVAYWLDDDEEAEEGPQDGG